MTSSRPVFYWHGFCSRVDLEAHDKEQLNKLLHGERSNLGFEKLKGCNIYSIRSNQARRILFTPFHHQGQCLALVLEILPTHDYENANCLKPGVIEAFLEKNSTGLSRNIENGKIDVVTRQFEDPFTKDPESSIEFQELDRYHGQFITLSQEQRDFKASKQMPLILCGPAGSGKTSTAISLLIDIVEEYHQQNTAPERPIAYISDKPHLIREVMQAWRSADNPISQTAAGQNIVFMTSQTLLENYTPARNLEAVSLEATHQMIRQAILKANHGKKDHPLLSLSDTQRLHEAGILMLCQHLEDYQSLGELDSNLNGALAHSRETNWKIIHEINRCLLAENRYIPSLFRCKPETHFSTTIYDEGQVGSPLTKRLAMEMTEAHRIVICVDALQTSDKSRPDVSLLIKKLGAQQQPVNVFHLNKCFRTPKIITEFANKILHMRRYLNGGLADKTELAQLESIHSSTSKPGALEWLDEKQVTPLLNANQFSNVNTAIVTHEALINQAQQHFNTGLVFTPDQIGGLEFDTVVLYRLTESKPALAVSQGLIDYHAEMKSPENLPKRNKGEMEHTRYMAELYTASTRAKRKLMLIERACEKGRAGDNKRRHLLNHLKSFVASLNQVNPVCNENNQPSPMQSTNHQDQWLTMIDRLIESNNLAQAKMVWKINLNRNELSFEAYCRERLTPNNQPKRMLLDESKGISLTTSKLKNQLKHQNYLDLFTKHNESNELPLIVRVLLNDQTIVNLIQAITDKASENRVVQIFKSMDLNQIVYYSGEEIPLLHFILNNQNACRLLMKISTHREDFLYTVLKPSEQTIKASSFSKTTGIKLPLLVQLSFTNMNLFCRLINTNSSFIHYHLNPWWLHASFENPDLNLETLLVRVLHHANQTAISKPSLEFIDAFPPKINPDQLFSLVNFNNPILTLNFDTLAAYPQGLYLIGESLSQLDDDDKIKQYLTDEFMLGHVQCKSPLSQSRLFILSKDKVCLPIVRDYLLHYCNSPNNIAQELTRIQSEAFPWNIIAAFVQTKEGRRTLYSIFEHKPEIIHAIPLCEWAGPGLIENFDLLDQFIDGLEDDQIEFIQSNYPSLYFKIPEEDIESDSEETESGSLIIETDEEDFDEASFKSYLQSEKFITQINERNSFGVTYFEALSVDVKRSGLFLTHLKSLSTAELAALIHHINFNESTTDDAEQSLARRMTYSIRSAPILLHLLEQVSFAMLNTIKTPITIENLFHEYHHADDGSSYIPIMTRISKLDIYTFSKVINSNPDLFEQVEPSFWLTAGVDTYNVFYSALSNLLHNLGIQEINNAFLKIISYKKFDLFRITNIHVWISRSFTNHCGERVSYIDLFSSNPKSKSLVDVFLKFCTVDKWNKFLVENRDIAKQLYESENPNDKIIYQSMLSTLRLDQARQTQRTNRSVLFQPLNPANSAPAASNPSMMTDTQKKILVKK